MLNQYVWQLYMLSHGRETAKCFQNACENKLDLHYVNRICDFHKNYCPSRKINSNLHLMLSSLCSDLEQGLFLLENGDYTIETALQILYTIIEDGIDISSKKVFENFTENIEYYSTLLAIEIPELFVPYYFKCNFNIFERIAQEFDISFPPVPLKRDYLGRFFYYGEICAALYEFRQRESLSPYELWSFLYDFAPKYIGGTDSYIIDELPSPKSAYFVGGSGNDCFLSEVQEEVVCWQCNPETMVGDAIVLYLLSPVSAIDSIWRSVSCGFNDPFFYYYRCTYISKPHKIKRISYRELNQNQIFNQLPIVKKNMQGLNGVEIMPSVYNYLLKLAETDLPHIESFECSARITLSREKDVENQLIKPFLDKLGYTENEYLQQVVIRLGNHQNKLIPDFVVHPVVTTGHQSADFLIEAKFSIKTMKILGEAKIQSRSYANLFNAKYAVIAAKEGIWITEREDDYSEDVLHFSWEELEREDNFHKVFAMLGNGKI